MASSIPSEGTVTDIRVKPLPPISTVPIKFQVWVVQTVAPEVAPSLQLLPIKWIGNSEVNYIIKTIVPSEELVTR